MASNFLKTQIHPIKIPSLFAPFQHLHHHFSIASKPFRSKPKPISPQSSLASSSPKPPSSKQEAILQAKTSLATTLQKPINNPRQFTGKMKRQKQPRFRAEIPVIDESPESITQLAFEVFGAMPIKRKGSSAKLLLIWPNPTLKGSGIRAFEQSPSSSVVEHIDLTTALTADNIILNSADVAVFLAPEASQLTAMRAVTEGFDPRPVVLFNPRWSFEEESEFGDVQGFVGSFDVVYAFLGLEVRGLLSRRQGVVFRCVRDGVSSGDTWSVLVEEEGGDLKVVSKFKSRPSIVEVENVLYNLMAVNSPITKSAKFLRDLVSNVTGKKLAQLHPLSLDRALRRPPASYYEQQRRSSSSSFISSCC